MQIVREIRPEEWATLKPFYDAEGGRLPNQESTTAAVAEDEHGICGFWALEMIPHVGPLYVAERARGNGLYRKLLAFIEEHFMTRAKGTGYYVFSASERTDHICESSGMVLMPWKVWKKEF